ncbi:hypothetical protein L873DRAFT_1934231, partial [Choiromyces venosus 120613-1]
MLDAKLPVDFWAEVINSAVDLHKWIPSNSLRNDNPEYILSTYISQEGNKKVRKKNTFEFQHLWHIGCVAYQRLPNEDITTKSKLKFGARSRISMMIGYTESSKIWRLWDFEGNGGRGRPVNCSDVIFIENENAWETVNGQVMVDESEQLWDQLLNTISTADRDGQGEPEIYTIENADGA